MPGKREKKADPFNILFRSTLGWAAAALLGTSAILLLRIPGFPYLVAAQTTAGIIGLGGGLSYAMAIRAAGGKIDGKNVIFVAVVWSLSCILGVTPLFFTLGTPLKMMVSAFYSFAFCGALGGIVTACRMRSLFPAAAARDCIPSAVLWSFSVGFAFMASNMVGEVLQRLLPAWVAWFIAYEAMALIIGGAGGFAIVRFQETRKPMPDAFEQTRRDGFSGEALKHPITVVILLCLPFYLNDLSDIYVKDWRGWLLIDYVSVKLLPLTVLAWLIRSGKVGFSSLGLRMPSAISFWSVLAVGALSAVFIEQNGYLLTGGLSGAPSGQMPEIENPVWRWVDLTAGLAMVSIVEEVVFRGYLRIFLSRYTRRACVVIGISAIAFGLIHWSGGLPKIMAASAVGAVFMALYLRTRSLPAIMVAHYLVNFIAFSNVVPQSLFRFF
ncbi:MAG: type II CAAX endopeptidase family protein [Deltaproteobacteria bacterium]|nr:type II CAAX endopeptidase family protein [Deltaproteobacteria bacterium]